MLQGDHVKTNSQTINWDREYDAHGSIASLNHRHNHRTPYEVYSTNQTAPPFTQDPKGIAHQNKT